MVKVQFDFVRPSSRFFIRAAIREASRTYGQAIAFLRQKDCRFHVSKEYPLGYWDVWIDRHTISKPCKLLRLYVDEL